MPIIKKTVTEFEVIKGIKINKNIWEEVQVYCNHFGFTKDEFLTQACAHVLRKDTDWKSVKKIAESNKKKTK